MSAISDEELKNSSDNEGEGQDLVNQEEPFDSSEEEEDDDEEEIQKIREGFIVDDEDEEGEKRRKKKHKRRHLEPKEDEGLLDEDDLDLLMENSGAKTDKSKFKRLKRATNEEEKSASKSLNDFFSDDEDEVNKDTESNQKRNVIDELDDFIEDDEDSELDEEERAQARQRRKEERLKPTELSGIDSEKVDELYDIFGDGEDYAWALEGEDEENEFRDDDSRPQLHDIYEPEELKARMLTDFDKVIRDTDIPERFQEIRRNIKNYDLSESDFEFEKQWITFALTEEKKSTLDAEFDHDAFAEAVGNVLNFVAKQNLEIPFIYSQRRDYLLKTTIIGEGDNATTQVTNLLVEDDLWRILQLDVDFHSLLDKRQQITNIISKLNVDDPILTERFDDARTITDFQDVSEFINFKYSLELKDLGLKKTYKNNNYDKIKNNKLYEIIKSFGITPDEFIENMTAQSSLYTTVDPNSSPITLAQEICDDPSSLYASPNQCLEAVKHYYAESLFTNVKFRKYFRDIFAPYGYFDVELTTQGRLKIDKNSPYADFKYAKLRTIAELQEQPDLFLRMLEAESLNLIELKIKIMEMEKFVSTLYNAIESDGQSDIALEWNALRRETLDISLNKILPLLNINIKEDIKRDCERLLFYKIRASFLKKLDQAPYQPKRESNNHFGAIPRVFAISPGEGHFGMDAIIGAFLNEDGKLVDTYKFDQNPLIPTDRLPEGETAFEIAFANQIKECDPDVIAINGFNSRTHKLYLKIIEIIEQQRLTISGQPLEVIFVNDEVASRYQYSTKATEEFPDKSTLVKYVIALARYVQSPLLEYVTLGNDITSLSIHQYQNLLSEDKLKNAIETVFVDIVNMVGVDINKCVTSNYLAAVLPYVAGLGERKAFGLLRAVQQYPLFSRQALITNQNITIGSTVFLNCASFLRIPQNRNRAITNDEVEAVTLLDDTRIHPEDYNLAEKMAADALDLDEEQIAELKDAPIGETIIDKLIDNGASLLNTLILEDYARQLEENFNSRKRATLQMILEELQEPFGEIRRRFTILKGSEIFETLTGETEETFKVDQIIPVLVKRVDRYTVYVMTSSLIACSGRKPDNEEFNPGQTVQAKIVNIDYNTFAVEISLNKNDISANQEAREDYKIEGKWDFAKEAEDLNSESRKEDEQKQKTKVINHPLFQPFNAIQAQNYLAPKLRGDLVIRPSSKGDDHTAITWKVDNNLYQHLDILEKIDPSTGIKRLQLGKQFYSDYDEIIQLYIIEVVKNVNAMMSHDKFHSGSKASVQEWLENYIKANPKKGGYIFALNHKRPGWFLLLFKTSAESELFTWNIKVVPNGYEMQNHVYPDMLLLCNGFKTIMQNGLNKPKERPSSQNYRNNNGYNQNYNNYNQGYNQGYSQNYSQGYSHGYR